MTWVGKDNLIWEKDPNACQKPSVRFLAYKGKWKLFTKEVVLGKDVKIRGTCKTDSPRWKCTS
jgi:hypothetical protein